MAWDDPISEPQVDLIKKLIIQKDLSSLPESQREFLTPMTPEGESDEEELESNLRLMNKKQASAAITALIACPNKPVIHEPPPEGDGGDEPEFIEVPLDDTQPDEVAPVQGLGTKAPVSQLPPQGYFFILDPTDEDKEKFFRVRHGKQGTRWEGYAFLDVQASDYLYPVKDPRRRSMIFAEIMKDPVKAMNEYGMRLGRCGVCGRTLTDRDSRLRGIGPICAQNLGPTIEQANLLRQLGLIKD